MLLPQFYPLNKFKYPFQLVWGDDFAPSRGREQMLRDKKKFLSVIFLQGDDEEQIGERTRQSISTSSNTYWIHGGKQNGTP